MAFHSRSMETLFSICDNESGVSAVNVRILADLGLDVMPRFRFLMALKVSIAAFLSPVIFVLSARVIEYGCACF